MAELDDRRARMILGTVVEPGDAVIGRQVAAVGSVETLNHGLPARLSKQLDPSRIAEVLDTATALQLQFLIPGDTHWPQGLADLQETAPLGLWVYGQTEALSNDCIAVVGARSATHYGEWAAADVAAGIAASGWTVVSGGAYGIDAAAHRGALAARGSTVAVLAGGVDIAYPRSNDLLFRAIVEQGALISESPPGTQPLRHRFLIRNRLIAAMSRATVVVEARLRSGASATAGHAATLGRDVMAVPGPITAASSAGCHQLIRDGAVLVTSAADVFELVAGDLPRHTSLDI
jgi:DNA processing protein